MELQKIVRKNIWNLKPYSCARDEFQGEASVFLDANENPNDTGFNRYPDPLQKELKAKISDIKNISIQNIFLGNGSDEAIDLVYRAFCEPNVDNVVAIEPTYGMYKVCADINAVEYKTVNLDGNFQFSADKMLQQVDEKTKVMWLCSPNNPTGNLLNDKEIEKLLDKFQGIVVVDEAYTDFANHFSWITKLAQYPNLVVLQTLSKAWASAAIRLGMAFSSEEIIQIFNKIKYPYNVNILTQKKALEVLSTPQKVASWVDEILLERMRLIERLKTLSCVEEVYPTDANFVLVKVTNADEMYTSLTQKGIIVRNRNRVTLCGNCLRITIGLREENDELLKAME